MINSIQLLETSNKDFTGFKYVRFPSSKSQTTYYKGTGSMLPLLEKLRDILPVYYDSIAPLKSRDILPVKIPPRRRIFTGKKSPGETFHTN